MVFQTLRKHFAIPAIWQRSFNERDALYHFQVVTGQARVFERWAEVAQLTDAEVLQNLRTGADF